MSAAHPCVDVNLIAYNAEATLGMAIESVLAQDWPALRLTVIDNGSTDATPAIAAQYASEVPWVRLHRARANAGQVANMARAFTLGDADFVLPKTADDLIAPDFVGRLMDVLLAHPDCALCAAAGLVFRDGGVAHIYPDGHRLHATGPDPVARSRAVMQRYTSAPSFWGIYRRAASDRLGPIAYRAGWDHALLAELALYGEVRQVPEPLYWRRDGGKPVAQIARGATQAAQRGHPASDPLGDLRWRTPLITTAHNHLDVFATAPLDAASRLSLMRAAPGIFRKRWLPAMRQEAAALRADLPALLARGGGTLGQWQRRMLAEAVAAVAAILPDEGFPLPTGP